MHYYIRCISRTVTVLRIGSVIIFSSMCTRFPRWSDKIRLWKINPSQYMFSKVQFESSHVQPTVSIVYITEHVMKIETTKNYTYFCRSSVQQQVRWKCMMCKDHKVHKLYKTLKMLIKSLECFNYLTQKSQGQSFSAKFCTVSYSHFRLVHK